MLDFFCRYYFLVADDFCYGWGGISYIVRASLGTLESGSCTKNMTSTGGCSYSFVYS